MRSLTLHPPKTWVGKAGLYGVPVCLALALFWWLHSDAYLVGMAVAALAATGTAVALWTLWQEHARVVERNGASEAHSQFLAAAEANLDAFSLFEAVRDRDGLIVDFRFLYVNANTERLVGLPRSRILGRTLCEVTKVSRQGRLFANYCRVVNTGEPLSEDLPIKDSNIKASWLRLQAVKLGDGLALTCSDISAAKAAGEQYRQLAEFTDSIFQNAPFSMIATDTHGLITAMNVAAEKLSGYSRDELVGKSPLTLLHDEKELAARRSELGPGDLQRDGFYVLTAGVAAGEMDEKEWTLVRRDGARTPINLAMRAVTSGEGAVSGFVGIAFDITERKQMLDYVTHLATHDQLTGLAGRALLQDKTVQAVEQARRYGTKVAVFMIDLDQFKRINDSLGHVAGDHVLVETANRLRRAVRSTDIVARMGGDEFVVVMPDITSLADVEQCAANLVAKLAPEISIDQHLMQVTASVGVCIYPDFAADAKHLLKRADSAMYVAKENGRNQHQIFSLDMLKESVDRLSMEHALRHALANNELHMHYQPQVSLTTGAVTGMEALLRWTHPKLGKMAPEQFISLAEETGLIVPIGAWAFVTACREGKALIDELGMDLTVSVNLSPRQLQQRNLVQIIENALKASGLPARNLEIEITEGMLMVNSCGNLAKLQQIRELGVGISIDDFGTGFSSFSYLLQYQVDRLKIDQSFVKKSVTDANAAAVVRTIIAMSHGLNIRVVAEGVETDEQLRFLLRRKCDEAQGNFVAAAVSAQDFITAVRTPGSGILTLRNH
ncbi:putative bifunctional diguanylate cyclase/phosphodiesterase [Edaphobacter sp.]|uniref:putative bifunctional diguanylate cyclase/phosphodiesterase n=1 Tax=Edaphobacter sp. TaxID=1934404 RepID=UPI002DC04F53|nr:EAL domain-containing protein [Edaphobacter sp.]HEU5341462.1 EAL domain-containing protein [Edaphobacter sp.]